MNTWISEIMFASPEYDESVDLRTRVLRVPLKMSFEIKDLAVEYKEWHLGCYSEAGKLLGCLILKPLTDKLVKMRQVAVEPEFQGMKIGQKLVQASEEFAKAQKCIKIELNARAPVIPFYQKLGYSLIGEPFYEVGIEHGKMIKEL
ncbi:MAG: GNAT family N-acetyltransferase [Saprospiraceae bacterium]